MLGSGESDSTYVSPRKRILFSGFLSHHAPPTLIPRPVSFFCEAFLFLSPALSWTAVPAAAEWPGEGEHKIMNPNFIRTSPKTPIATGWD